MNFEGLAKDYDLWYGTPFGKYADKLEKKLIFEFLSTIGGKTILDVGCGTGKYTLRLTNLGAIVFGLDPSVKMLKIAKEKNGKIPFILGTAENLPFKPHSFDVIVSITSLCFVSDARKATEEMKRDVKPTGKIVVGVLNKWSLYTIGKKIKSHFKESIYGEARFYDILELKNLFGEVRWDSTLFALDWMPSRMLKIFLRSENFLSILLKPFGAFIVIEAKNHCDETSN